MSIKYIDVVGGPSFKDLFFKSTLFGDGEAVYFEISQRDSRDHGPGINVLIHGLTKILNRENENCYTFVGTYSPHMSVSSDPNEYVVGVYNTDDQKGYISIRLSEEELESVSLQSCLIEI